MSDADPTPQSGPPTLQRGLKLFGTLLIVLSAVTPASSVFIIAPGVIAQAGTGAVWSFLAAGVVGIFMAFVYAELSSAYPLAGGEYAIVGRTLGRPAGFVILGLILITQIMVLAVIALGVGTYLGVLVDGLNAPAVAAVCVALAAVVAIFDIKVNAAVTGVFLAIEMVALLVLTALGLINVERPLSEVLLSPVVADAGSGSLVPAAAGLIAAATAVAIFAYNGYGSAVIFGEEARDASRTIARAILWALGITVAAELIPVTAMLLGAPSLQDLLGADNMLSYFITARGGTVLNTVISLAVALAIFNAVIAIMLLTARIIFSSGRDSTWSPRIDRKLAELHPRFNTPWIATIVTGALAVLACLIDETFLLVATGTTLVAVYAALCLAAIAGRRNGSTAHAAYKMPLFPLAPVAALLALAFVVYQSASDPAVGRPSLLVTAVVILASIAYYALVLRRRGGWKLHGATEEQTSADPAADAARSE